MQGSPIAALPQSGLLYQRGVVLSRNKLVPRIAAGLILLVAVLAGASDGLSSFLCFAVPAVVLLAASAVVSFTLHISVDASLLRVNMGEGSWARYEARLLDIVALAPATVSPVELAMKGFPARRLSDGALLLGPRGPALHVRLANGTNLFVGTDDVEGLARAIVQARAALGAPLG